MKSKKKLPLLFGTLAAGVVCLTMGVGVLGATPVPQTEIKQQTQIVQQATENVGELRLVSSDGTQSNGVPGQGLELTVSQWSRLNTYGVTNSLSGVLFGSSDDEIWQQIQNDVLTGGVTVFDVQITMHTTTSLAYRTSIKVVSGAPISASDGVLTVAGTNFTPENVPSGSDCAWTGIPSSGIVSGNMSIDGYIHAPGSITLSASEGSVVIDSTSTFTVDSNHGGELRVESYNESIATASISGTTVTVTGVGAGETAISVVCAATEHYAEATAVYPVTVNKKPGFVTLSGSSNEVTVGAEAFTFTVATNHGGALSVSSNDTSIATASISGTTVTVTPSASNTGTATITVTCATTEIYNSASTEYVVTVNPATPWTTMGTYISGGYNVPTIVPSDADGGSQAICYNAWAGYKWVWFGADDNFNGGSETTNHANAYDTNSVRWIIVGEGRASGKMFEYVPDSSHNGVATARIIATENTELLDGEILLFSESAVKSTKGTRNLCWAETGIFSYLNENTGSDFISNYLDGVGIIPKKLISLDNYTFSESINKVFLFGKGYEWNNSCENFVYETYLGQKEGTKASCYKGVMPLNTYISKYYYWLRSIWDWDYGRAEQNCLGGLKASDLAYSATPSSGDISSFWTNESWELDVRPCFVLKV